MITREYLIEFYDRPMGRKSLAEIIEEIEKECFPVSILYDISFTEKQQVAFHAAWTIEKMYENNTEIIDLVIENLLKDFNKINNHACSRHYGKLVAKVLELNEKGKATPIMIKALKGSNDETLIEGCFKWLIEKDTPIGTKVWQLEILSYYTKKYSWIKEEIIPIAQSLLLNGTPASINYGRRLLKRLNSQNTSLV